VLALVVLAAAALPVAEAGLGTYARGTRLLRWAAVLMPLGFLAGGLFPLGSDPGPAIVLVPIGGVLLLVGVLTMARLCAPAPRT